MDNRKIGRLIAELRKKQGLTQQELGDMVGVGFKAVSKWECGTTLPDITIINEVSKILGITTDELLNGELNVEPPVEETAKEKKKISPKLVITISIITVLLIFITTIYAYQSNKTNSYNLTAVEYDEYFVEGKAYFKKGTISIMIEKIHFKNESFSKSIIQNYEYVINSNNKFIFGYGYIDSINNLDNPVSITEFSKRIRISYDGKINMPMQDIIEKKLVLKFKFLTDDNEEIIKEIVIELDKK